MKTLLACLVWLAGVAVMLCLILVNVHATPTDGGHGIYHEWFGAQVIPKGDPNAGASCCAESDGHIIDEDDWRIAAGQYEVRIGDKWVAIPETRVLPYNNNPTGHPVVWYTQPIHIYCFVPGTVS